MKIYHISDLHIGKQLHYYDLKEEQEKVLRLIVEKVREGRPDVLLIAGDVYDRAVPSGEAHEMFGAFLEGLAEIQPRIPVLIIAGNHDNASRLGFASGFLRKSKIWISVMPPVTGQEHLEKVVLSDTFGDVNFYLLPFTKPGYVRQLFPGEEIENYDMAVRRLLEREEIDFTKRNVLMAHQFFVAGDWQPEKSDSEMTYVTVGGIDSVDVSCVRDFDYVALGHIHGAQKIGGEHIRYSGTPLKYSVSEEKQEKGITVVTLGEKGKPNQYDRIPLVIKPDVRSIKGTLNEVLEAATEENKDDYVSIILTDEDVYRPKDQLEEKYSHILEVRFDNKRTRARLKLEEGQPESLDPLPAFAEFYQELNGQPLSGREEAVMTQVIDEVRQRLEEE